MSSVTPEVDSGSGLRSSAYDETIRQLYERINYEKGFPPYSDANYRLDRMRKLLAGLDDPQLAAPILHIAGTKGKGSTATLLSHMLASCGYQTGLYTSPHLVKLEERFRVNNIPCGPEQLIELIHQAITAADRVEAAGGGRATFFELTTAAAFLHFAQQKVKAIVLEVGLGGRLDSTNVCQPVASIITTIGLDHQAQLGSTIAAIAGEKAGIIKPGTPVLSSARHPDAREVIIRRAAAEHAPLRLIERDFSCKWHPILNGRSSATGDAAFDASNTFCETARVEFQPHYPSSLVGPSQWSLSMLGRHQADNLAVALATIDTLAEQGWSFERSSLHGAVQQTAVTARLQIVARSPWRIIDTAHNPDSIAATLQALHIHFPNNRRTLILGVSRDKDVDGIMRLILPACDRLILTQYHNNVRGLAIEELQAIAERARRELAGRCAELSRADTSPSGEPVRPAIVTTAPTAAEAWKIACHSAQPDELICATGSFFLAADLLSSSLDNPRS